ncbi:DUF3810 domain-containing protein [Ulvibacterium sp.]|uniref:DUF3810 domain-containing protein n=1 Tax=Ulvibacterium sp. TaxID=2665914 RepID=UPI002637DB15|nr:DUF3810 domain-containing protein [Ulvibacterium sp.]
MKNRLKNGIAIALIPQIVLVKALGANSQFIETYYSEGMYPWISQFFRWIFGWIPFSVGDILYFSLIFFAVRYLIVHRKYIKDHKKGFFRDVIMVLSTAYFTFHLLWGFNYYRQPIGEKLVLPESHTQEDLIDLTEALTAKTNALQLAITKDSTQRVEIPYTNQEIFGKTIEGYQKLEKSLPFLAYNRPSIKTSLFSTGLTYMGYGGYLNPFTNEGQVNGRLPNFRFPVVAGHEIGHQVGYSAEDETNFIGYLVTANNDDLYFQYSASAYALGYCLSEIRRRDDAVFKRLYAQLHTGVQGNFREIVEFWRQFENPLEPVFKSIFDSFLKANSQAEGIKSYNAVVSLLVNYHKENPL